MNIQIASDLHLERQNIINTEEYFSKIIVPSSPILILAGDIGYPEQIIYKSLLEYCSKHFEKIVLIAGNHEYYSKKPISSCNENINNVVSNFENVYFLNNSYIEIDDFVILGTTLWSLIDKTQILNIMMCLSDLRYIHYDENKKLDVNNFNEMHINCYKWLKEHIDIFSDKKIIVVSHHLPSYKLIHNKYTGSKINSAFASTLDHLFSRVNCWVFGHSHASCEKTIDGCLLVSNPYGYSEKENLEYRSNLIYRLE